MEKFEIEDRAHALLEELLSFGVCAGTIERAFRSALAAERAACMRVCQDVMQEKSFDAHQQLAVRTCLEGLQNLEK